MVIKVEYGNFPNAMISSSVRRDVTKGQLVGMVESFFQQQYTYRWGKMYSLKGTEAKLIRQF